MDKITHNIFHPSNVYAKLEEQDENTSKLQYPIWCVRLSYFTLLYKEELGSLIHMHIREKKINIKN